MTTPEGSVQDYLDAQVRQRGGSTRKVRWEGRTGAPDKLVLLPSKNRPLLVEVKRPGKQPTPAQAREMDRLRQWFQVEWVNSRDMVDALMERLDVR